MATKKKKRTGRKGKTVEKLTLTLGLNRVITITWSFNTTKYKGVDHYEVETEYHTTAWMERKSSSVKSSNATKYTAPNDANQVRVRVKPVAKDVKKGKGKGKKWNGAWSAWKIISVTDKEATPARPQNAPTLTIKENKLTAYIENYSSENGIDGVEIEFEIIKDGVEKVATERSGLTFSRATISVDVAYGGTYSARCRAVKNGLASEWTDYTEMESGVSAPPDGIASITSITTLPDNAGVRLTWTPSTGAEKYEIQYIKDKTHFDISSEASSVTTPTEQTEYIVSGFSDSADEDREWFFRVRGINDGGGQGGSGEGPWSPIVSIVVGEKPDPPTTWTYTTSVAQGKDIELHWTHNSVDGSKQRQAEIVISYGGHEETIPITTPTGEDPIEKYSLGTAEYPDSAELKWKVRTLGAVDEWSDYSVQRTIRVYASPAVGLSFNNHDPEESEQLINFPLILTANASPASQKAISFAFSIEAMESYDYVDDTGMDAHINRGNVIFSKFIDNPGTNTYSLTIRPSDITLESDISYRARVTAAMDSGLTAKGSLEFTAAFADDEYEPDGEVIFNEDTLSAMIRPYCIDDFGNIVTSGALLSVYRRNFDGTFTLIQGDIPMDRYNFVPDPHPALDYARYRIVAQSVATGQVSYYDLPGYPIHENSIVIQWDEQWTNFDYEGDGEPVEPVFAGSMVKLPYNVDVADGTSPDMSLVEYIGREHPVSYYGTQQGYTAQWNCEIPKDDRETLYALRRLQRYMGDVYVREPSGTGYWASIKVQISMAHNEKTVPISLDITRVEGGM